MDVGKRIRELRKQHNMTTNELANLCNTTQPVISKLENGHRIPDVPTLKKICEVFDITLADFFAPEGMTRPVESDLEELLNSAKELSPEQIKSLSTFLKTIVNKKYK
ncbi:helix-turn-helix domain-containing protein [Clostridium sp. Cult1]|uniref:helix-turn-helix domain-containing protein n=1 Tax=Clostridium sp. Cult1 TaxID=2079002 RepID=UPI001F1992A6|nr:helix-turn-helix transcriptional regulator [Clostridium sp. Cult1]